MEVAVVYRRYAAHCVRSAQQVADQKTRATMLDMAQVWLGLADQAERSSRGAERASELAVSAPAETQSGGPEPSGSSR
jgi:hypothetical protein